MQKRKKGTVKAYSKQCNAGVIECEDGTDYRFRKSELIHGKEPEDHEKVEFDEDRQDAKNVDIEEESNR